MKRIVALALLASCIAITVPGTASAWRGGGGWHGGGFRGGFGGFHHGFRGGGFGFYPGYYGYGGYAYGGCWQWVRWPYWHRVYTCY